MTFLTTILLIAAKDLRLGFRNRQNLATVLFFALTMLVIFLFAFELAAVEFGMVGPGLLWAAVAFAGLLGLQGTFAREGERDAFAGLVLSSGDPAAIYLGKVLAALVLLLLVEALLVPAAALLFNVDLRAAAVPLGVVFVLNTTGFVGAGTLFAAMATRLRRGNLLLPLLQFTVTMPLFLAAVRATSGVLTRGSLDGAGEWLRLTIAYDMVIIAVAALLFETLTEE
jgi:heme exporter protein B